MRSRIVVVVAVLVGLVALAWPTARIELALRSVPVGSDATLVEDVTRGGRLCVIGACPERLRVWRSAEPFAARCETTRQWIATLRDDVRELDIGTDGFARCGWVVERGPVTLGVVVEEQSPGSDLIVTSRS